MRMFTAGIRLAVLALAAPALGGGFNTTYLVPAFVSCPGPDICVGTPQRESRFTFDSVTLRTPRGQFADPKKPSFIVELKGVKDGSGAPVTSSAFTIRIATGQINLFNPATLRLPPGHPLAQVDPVAITLANGRSKTTYKPTQTAGAGTVVEGGAVTVYDSDGKRLATVGSQYK